METLSDLQEHIRKRLTEIEELTERRVAKELLLEGLMPIFERMEKRYLDLESQVRREIEVPDEKYAVYTTVIKQKDYDPINGTLYPAVPELLEEEQQPYLLYFSGSCAERAAFERTGQYPGSDAAGRTYRIKVRRAACYRSALQDLYQVFVYNRMRWTTVNTGYLDRFYELYADEEVDIRSLTVRFGKYEKLLQKDMLLLWNIEKFTFQCHKFMVPCIDDKYYEHELDLKNYDRNCGYMLGKNEDVLKVRHEKDKIIMTSLQQSFQDWEAYRFIGAIDMSSQGYDSAPLGNIRKESFFQNYREKCKGTLGSQTELFWIVQSFGSDLQVCLEACEVLEKAPQNCYLGDMNPFLGNAVFPMESRKALVLRFRQTGQDRNMSEDMVRFFVSQIQLSVSEYQCVGILMGQE